MTIDSGKPSDRPLRPLCGCMLAVASVLGCGGADAGDSASALSDTPVWVSGQEWRLSEEPLFTIGAMHGDEAIGRVAARIPDESGVALLSGGRVAVTDVLANHIRFYDEAGKRLSTAGRYGDGPGEFRGLRWIYEFADGDSLIAWDSMGRLSILSADGAFVRTHAAQSFGILGVDGVARNGTSFVEMNPSAIGWERPSAGEYRYPRPYRLVSASGDSVASFGPILGGEVVVSPDLPGGFGYRTFGRHDYAQLGRRFIYSGENTSFEIAVSRPGASEPDRYLRRPFDPISVPAALLSVRNSAVQQDRTYPAFRRIVEDADENVWVRHGAPDADPTFQTWSVFGPDGAWLGEVRFPASISIRAIGRDVIAVVVKDDLSVEYVKVFRIVKPDI